MYKKAFWILIFITIITMTFQIAGYDILGTVIFLIVMDFIALWLYLEKRSSLTKVDDVVIKRIENIEMACSSILEGIGSVSSSLNLEEKIIKQKEDVNSMLEKINEKTLYLEDRLNNFGHNLSSHLTTLDEKEEPSNKEQF